MKKILATFLGFAIALFPAFTNATVLPTGRAYSGDLTISSGTTSDNATESSIVSTSTVGIASTTVSSVSGFAAGQYVLLITMSGSNAGKYEFQQIRSVVGSSIFFYGTLANEYDHDATTSAQVVKVSEYHNVTLTGGTWTAGNWDGSKGGVLVAFLTGSLFLNGGTITAPTGFGGGAGFGQGGGHSGFQGSSSLGVGIESSSANGMAGGGGASNGVPFNDAGGGAGYATVGSAGGGSGTPGSGGGTGGAANLQSGNMFMGAGGGGGWCGTAGPCSSGSGGSGAGIIFVTSASSTLSTGTLNDNGTVGGTGSASGGGGGAGGSVRLPVRLNLTLGTAGVTATGGAGGGTSPGGGAGSSGRFATVSSAVVASSTLPAIDVSSTDYVYDVDNRGMQVALGASF